MVGYRFSPLFMPPSERAQYEVLLDDHEQEQRKNWNTRARISIAAMVVLALAALRSLESSTGNQDISKAANNGHTIPTLLSVVHHEEGHYLFALENPLYERLKAAKFTIEPNLRSMILPPTLSVDRYAMNLRDPLTLFWSHGVDNSGNPVLKDSDVIALYCGDQASREGSDLTRKQFLEAATVAQARATHQKHNHGASEVSFDENDEGIWHIPSFPVLRHDICFFALFQALPDNNFALLDTSDVIQIDASRTTPTAIHLALGDEPSEMLVQFTTGDEQGTPVARYSREGSKKDHKATGTTKTYIAADMCEAPANETEAGKFQPPGMLHAVRLTNLEPNTVYQYKVGLAHGLGITWSDSFSFTTPPLTGDQGPYSMIVYGDQGCPANGWGSGGAWTAAMTTREVLSPNQTLPIRAIHHFGDLSYAKGAAHVWDEWFEMISSFTTKVPLMIAVGNHEYDHWDGTDPSGVLEPYRPLWANFANDSGGECGVPTVNHFTMPNSTNSNSVFWYSFDFGNTHTIIISSEHDLSPGSRQYQWLEQDLNSVNRTLTPWVIVEMHRPLYEPEMDWDNNGVGIARRYQIEDLLRDYKVDLVLSGHYHSYFRSCDGLYNSKCHNNRGYGGPTHITVGSAGAALNDNELYDNQWTEAFVKQVYGYGRITVANASALRFQFVKAGESNDTSAGDVLDDVWIWRDR